MVRAVIFDLFETLITESATRPPGVSSLAPALGCERDPFRTEWRVRRPLVILGRLTFQQALAESTAALGHPARADTLHRLSDERRRSKSEAFARIEPEVPEALALLEQRGLRLGVVSNCCAEDVAAWSGSHLAPHFICTTFSFQAQIAKPDPRIYVTAANCLGVEPSHTWYIGDGADDELAGAEQAGLRAFKARWFLRRWPHYREIPERVPTLDAIAEVVAMADRELA